MTKQKEINWCAGERAGLEFEYEGLMYRKGSNQCVFELGDLVINSSRLYGPTFLLPAKPDELRKRTTGIVLDITQPDKKDWPILEILWSTQEFTDETANHLWKVVRGSGENESR